MDKVAVTLCRFARSRYTAYKKTRTLDLRKASAISRIIEVMNFRSQKSQKVQLIAVCSIETELRAILPNESSRFQPQRQKILEIIFQSHETRKNRLSERSQISASSHFQS